MAKQETLLMFVVLCSTVLSIKLTHSEPHSARYRHVANVDGKAFFAETTNMTWAAGVEYCKLQRFEIAEITSQPQLDGLTAAFHETDFNGRFWVSGRDVQNSSQFIWNDSPHVVVEQGYFAKEQNDLPYQTCVLFSNPSKNVTDRTGLMFWKCSFQTGVLCQLVVNNPPKILQKQQ